MSLVATVEALVEAGATPQMILAVVRAHEASRDDALSRRRESDAARQRAKRERSNNVMSRDVTGLVNGHETPPLTRVRDITSNSEISGLAVVVEVSASERAQNDWPEGDPTKTLIQLVNSPRLDPNKSPGLVTTAGRLAAWRRDGASWQFDVVPVIEAAVRKTGPPIGTWKYFDAAIAQSIADNRQALKIPEAHERNHPDQRQTARQDRLGRMLAGALAASD